MRKDKKRLEKLVDDEYFDLKLYEMLLKYTKGKKERRILERLYEKEKKDLNTLLSLVRGYRPRVNRIKLALFFLLFKLFGTTFTVKMAEKDEQSIIKEYSRVLANERDKDRRKYIRNLIRSTKRYEYMLREWIKDERLKYISFVALGTTDAVISLVGTQAGFLGATESSYYVALSTLIVGLATGISMAAATYIQAKEMKDEVDPRRAAISSLKTYGVVTALLTLPFFLFDPYIAFLVAFAEAITVLSVLTYYTSLVNNRNFLSQLKENLVVVLLAILLGFVLGKITSIVLEQPF